MKRSLLLLTLLFMSGVVVRSQDREWRRYKVKDEEFSVTLPTVPAMRTNKGARKSDGKSRLERRMLIAYDGVYYTIQAFENPKPKQSLEQFISELNPAGGYEYDPATKQSVAIDGFDGIQYSAANKNSAAIVQFLAKEKHLYCFIASGVGIKQPEVK